MTKDSAPKTKTHHRKEHNSPSSMTQQSPATVKDGQTGRNKRKASPEQGTPKTTKKRRLNLNQDNEAASSSVDTNRVESSSKRSRKRKAADDGEGPSRKKMRSPDLKDTQQTAKQTTSQTTSQTTQHPTKHPTKQMTQHKTQQMTKQMTKQTTQQTTQHTTKQTAQQTTQQTTQHMTKHTTKQPAQQMTQQTAQQTTQQTTQHTTKHTTKQPAQQMTQQTAQHTTQQTTQHTTKHTTKQPAQQMTQQTAQQTTQQTTQHTTKQTAQQTTQQTTQHTTKQTAQQITQQTTQQRTYRMTKQISQQSTQQMTQDAAKETVQQKIQQINQQRTQHMTKQTAQQTTQHTTKQTAQQTTQQTTQHTTKQTAQQTTQQTTQHTTKQTAQQTTQQTIRQRTLNKIQQMTKDMPKLMPNWTSKWMPTWMTENMTKQNVTVLSPRTKFETKYEEQNQLGAGGCGSVYAGYRKTDNLPVAIKHIPKDLVLCKHEDNNGNQISVEVAIMEKLSAGTSGSAGTSAPVSLLDWYDLDQELILVMERPVPCVDLYDYAVNKGGCLQEEEAKTIMKQLIKAAIELEDEQIFHRDIKLENILIETGSDFPRVRLIDFGLSCFAERTSSFGRFYGTAAHIPPEWYSHFNYTAGPTTVWQMGVVLYDSLHRKSKFDTERFIKNELKIKRKLSENCQNFLETCLARTPEQRPTLEQLQHHPWLR